MRQAVKELFKARNADNYRVILHAENFSGVK